MSEREMNSNKLKVYLSQLETEGEHVQKFSEIIDTMCTLQKEYYAVVGTDNKEVEDLGIKLNQYRVAFSSRLTKLMLN